MAPLRRSSQRTNPPESSPLTPILPSYFQMIFEALNSLKDRNGSSQSAIARYLEEKYDEQLPLKFDKILDAHLKELVNSHKLDKISLIRHVYKMPETKEKVIEDDSVDESDSEEQVTGDDSGETDSEEQVIGDDSVESDSEEQVTVDDSESDEDAPAKKKMKELDQLKTPEAMKKKVAKGKVKEPARKKVKELGVVKTPEELQKKAAKGKMKRLSQVHTPDALKSKKKQRRKV